MDFMSILGGGEEESAVETVASTLPTKTGGKIYSKIMPAEKDNIVKSLMNDNISECAIYLNKNPGEPCASSKTISAIGQSLGVSGPDGEIMASAKAKLSCGSERCVLTKMSHVLGEISVRREIESSLKVPGPTSSSLLSNVHIDNTLLQWAKNFPGFFPYNFNMRNYASFSFRKNQVLSQPDTLATVQFEDLYLGNTETGAKYTHCGCVINSDVYQGDGKHWMALFADASGDQRWTIEFFNSSGNSPAPEWVSWMEKTRIGMERLAEKTKKTVKIVTMKVTSIRHQESKSECGLYSLFYIWARIHKIPPEYFISNHIPDQLMFEFRQHLFDDPTRQAIKKFNWAEYSKTTNIKWES